MEARIFKFYFNYEEMRSKSIVAESFNKAYESLSEEEKEKIINVYGEPVTLVK